ncbi:hypothetical protein [Streptomyces sp. NPDC016845]|uniref:hypothetical protein n=1 Tax=Streptomyces sp. NPDC016845 TaxID=3364972 RepID=UPI00379A90F5
MPVALTLFSVFGGAAIGVMLRRTLTAMVITLVEVIGHLNDTGESAGALRVRVSPSR